MLDMGYLPNSKWESFAAHVAGGLSISASYRAAGFTGSYPGQSGHALLQKPAVAERVAELRLEINKQRTELAISAGVGALRDAVMTRNDVMTRLIKIAETAKKPETELRALQMIGSELGMFVARSMEIQSPVDGMTPEQLLAIVRLAESMQSGNQVAKAAPTAVELPPVIEGTSRDASREDDGTA